ncbi:2-keto-4-pentenoate hydratase [Liquorilactobacillus satsumensis]|uniref:2-oxo-hept-3-ene-1,7-dioate hydratase n=2 Tax=Liquorilactobacillus satsumensis TaxID=259059 RepID=A0A0R1V421_9LACO|nr:2-oxo-hept-3-ene-1,7-dioate hydratase [Liquorilactobacillus satsumensis DSM 16230 = JCM 12392]MCC7666400.1 2-keto-4-pentenoate hydratase [Liquorilactobacillus satsumensis]MCP9357675.1 2-keto-4-pentenoate hydratase [Liquorilactobacillus satsumensis]MCP9371415.1 2-keto-4-pentenoate hydratase [Liquorilactobacillus satsumensis]
MEGLIMNQTQTKAATSLTTKQAKFAQELFTAYSTRTPLNMADWEGTVQDEATAYLVQERLTQLKEEKVAAYKVSLTSAETQKMFASTSPLYGAQVASRLRQSPTEVSLSELMEPLVEVELEFRAVQELKSTDSLTELMEKTTVAAGLEVPDSRFKDWFPTLSKYLVMSDAAVGGLVLYGTEKPTTDVFKTPEELAQVHCELRCNDRKLKEGVSAEVLDNPLNSLHWLVTKLEQQGHPLTVGQLVSTGTFVLPPKLTAGRWSAKFDHGLGNVDVTVTK